MAFFCLSLPVLAQKRGVQDTLRIKVRQPSYNTAEFRNSRAIQWQKEGYFLAYSDSIAPQEFVIIKGPGFDTVFLTWPSLGFTDSFFSVKSVLNLVDDWLRISENTGYPFAKAQFKVVNQRGKTLSLRVESQQGDYRLLDSIHFGNTDFSARALKWMGGVFRGMEYNHAALVRLLYKMSFLDGIRVGKEPDILMENGALHANLPVYKSAADYISGIVGIATNPTGGPVITGEVSARFYNMFRTGVYTGLEWRSFRARSQQLKLYQSIPYIAGLPFILRSRVEIEKFDTLFTNIGRGLELQLPLKKRVSLSFGAYFTDRQRIFLDKTAVSAFRRLPDNPAARNANYHLGLEFSNLSLGVIPDKGLELKLKAGSGSRVFLRDAELENIRWINSSGVMENIYDSLERTGRFKITNYRFAGELTGFVKIRKFVVLKLAAEGTAYFAPGVYFNELERYGGIKNFRGFNEQSIFASEFYMGTAELRFQDSKSGYIGPFYHLGWYRDASGTTKPGYGWLQGAGIAAALKTGAGILNFAWAVGKSGSQAVALNQSRFHFGLSTTF